MTAPQATDPAAWLDRLQETWKAATPGRTEYPSRPWLEQNPDEPQEIEAVWSDGARMVIGECFEEATVTAIVAEHNATPALIAAVRGVLAKCDALEAAAPIGRFFAEEFRGVVTAALGATGGER